MPERQGDDASRFPSISADGRFVAFFSDATNLVAGDTNGADDVFVRDRKQGTTERVSVSSAGEQANAGTVRPPDPSISADGRFVAFESYASNLVAGDTYGTWDVFVRDRSAGTTELVSVSTAGEQGNDGSGDPSISADGRFVAFESSATNLVAGDTNGADDVFVRDRQAGTTELVSVSTAGRQGNAVSPMPRRSPRTAASSPSRPMPSNLVAGDTNGTDGHLRPRPEAGHDETRERVERREAGERAAPATRRSRPTAASSPSVRRLQPRGARHEPRSV